MNLGMKGDSSVMAIWSAITAPINVEMIAVSDIELKPSDSIS